MIIVFGLPRSGTHYLRALVELNFPETTIDQMVWEHSFPDPEILMATAKAERLIIYKDLDHWLDSIERRIEDHGARWQLEGLADGRSWLELYADWRSAWTIHGHQVRYESILADPATGLDWISTMIKVPVRGYREPELVDESPNWVSDHRRRYL